MNRFFRVLLLLLVLTSSQAFTKNKKNRGKRKNDNVQAQPVIKAESVVQAPPVKQVEAPEMEAAPVAFTEPALEAGSLEAVEPLVKAEAVIPSEPVIEAQSTVEAEPINITEEVVQDVLMAELETSEPVALMEPAVEVETIVRVEPAVESEPVAQIEPVVEAEAIVRVEPAVESEPVAHLEPAVEAEEIVQVDPAVESESIAQIIPEIESDLVAQFEPAAEVAKPSLGMQDTGEKPASFEYFAEPIDSLRIAARYLPDNPVIVEAGAFDGKESCIMAYLWPNGEIHAFEPVSQLYDRVLERTNPIFNISVYKRALGDRCGEQMMYLSNERGSPGIVSMSSSLYPPKEHLLYCPIVFEGAEMVKTTTLDRWAEENGVPQVDMLWLDMQGYELPALKAAPNIISGVSVILTELEFVEAYEGQPLYQEVRTWLEEQGFVLVAGNFWFPKNPDQWFGDGLFVRKELLN